MITNKIEKALKSDTHKKITKKIEIKKYDKDKEDALILKNFENPYQYLPYDTKLNIIHKVRQRNIRFEEEEKSVEKYIKNKNEIDEIFETNCEIFINKNIEFAVNNQCIMIFRKDVL